MRNAIGVDIGGTKCSVVLGASDGEAIAFSQKSVFETPGEPEEALREIGCHIASIIRYCEAEGYAPEGIGISCGGPLDSRSGVILSPPNLPGWDNIQITRQMSERFNLPVWLGNDADACAVAEWKYGAGRGCRNLVFLTFGTGMGAGLILNGQLYTGSSDMAGECGHVRLSEFGPSGYGKMGSFEAFCSGGGIAQLGQIMARERIQQGDVPKYAAGDLEGITAKSIAEAANDGDQTALDVYRTVGNMMGRGLAILIDILNPEMVVAGSIFLRSHNLIWPYAKSILLHEGLRQSVDACQVVPSQLGEAVGDYAAVALALYRNDGKAQ